MNRLLASSVVAMVVAGCSGSGTGTGGGAGGGSGGGDAGVNRCGNGTLETDEACEGFELRGETCVSQGYEKGQLRCSSTCVLDATNCSKCGDGKVTALERCDPADQLFAGKTCASEVDAGAFGDLSCVSDCNSISTANCRFPPGRNEPCSLMTACATGLFCDLVSTSPVTFRCRPHCPLAGAGTTQGCPAGSTCTDGVAEFQGADAPPGTWVECPIGNECSVGFSCSDAGSLMNYCVRRTGYCP